MSKKFSRSISLHLQPFTMLGALATASALASRESPKYQHPSGQAVDMVVPLLMQQQQHHLASPRAAKCCSSRQPQPSFDNRCSIGCFLSLCCSDFCSLFFSDKLVSDPKLACLSIDLGSLHSQNHFFYHTNSSRVFCLFTRKPRRLTS